MKASHVCRKLLHMLGIKDSNEGKSDMEIITDDYIVCMKYFISGKDKPVVLGFKEGACIWLNTSLGCIELDEIPHNNGYLKNCVYEIETLIGENGYSEETVVLALNERIKMTW